MWESIAPYQATLAAFVALGVVVIVQFGIADLAGMRARHVPGMPVTSGHDDFFFRAVRTLANTNESLALFVLLALTAILAGATPEWTARWAWLWVGGRAAYTVCYYANWRLARSTVFAIGQAGLVGLLVVAALALAR
jgi:uncharacterized MAPEG superfamily protein